MRLTLVGCVIGTWPLLAHAGYPKGPDMVFGKLRYAICAVGDKDQRTLIFRFYDKCWQDYEDFLGPRPATSPRPALSWALGTLPREPSPILPGSRSPSPGRASVSRCSRTSAASG